MGKPWKTEFDIWIYPTLPEGMRVATREDFLDEKGELILGKDFLVKSFHFDKYEAHKTRPNFCHKWGPWLKESQIFVTQNLSKKLFDK